MSIQVIKTKELYKRSDEILDYDFDFTKFLSNGADTIATASVTVGTGLTKGATTNTTTKVKQWLSGGTSGGEYEVLCSITTASGRTKRLKLTSLRRRLTMPHSLFEIDRRIRKILEDIDSIENVTVESATTLLSRLREQTVLAVAEAGELNPTTAREIKHRLNFITLEYQRKLQELMTDNQRRMFVKGIKVVDEAVSGADIMKMIPYLSTQILEEVQNYSASLITALTNDARARIASEIDLAVLGQKASVDVIAAIGKNLDDPSVFGTIRRRAELISRTEINRIQAIATQRRMEQHAKLIPDLRKEWVHSHLGFPPRFNHVAMDGVSIGVSERFTLMGRDGEVYEILHPYDPILPAGETVSTSATKPQTMPANAHKSRLAARCTSSGTRCRRG